MQAPANRVYMGNREPEAAGPATVLKVDGEKTTYLDPRNDLRDHSPDGFQWGYGGSGPAQLALALCADALGDDARARSIYQRFKFNTVARITGDTWRMTAAEIVAEIESLEKADACQS